MTKTIQAHGITFHRKRDGWIAMNSRTHECGDHHFLLTVLVWKWFRIGPKSLTALAASQGMEGVQVCPQSRTRRAVRS